MNNYKILSVKDEDLEQCLHTIQLAFKKSTIDYGLTKENYPSGGAFITLDKLKQTKANGVHMYAAWVDDKIVGYVQLQKKDDGVYSFQKFAVLPEFQQFGIGKSLIEFCKNKAKVYGGKKIVLVMINENEKLKQFYSDNGFKLVGTKTDDAHPFLQGLFEFNL